MTAQITNWLAQLVRRGAHGVILNYHTLNGAETRGVVETMDKQFDFIGHDDLPRRIEHPGKRPFCLLTFDDGKRINATETAPVLTSMGVPGVFYVTTDFLDDGQTPLWFDLYAALRKQCGTLPPSIEFDIVKILPHALRLERVREECQRNGVTVDITDDTVAPMSWDDARKLHRSGHTIGSHTRWHSILTNEPFEEAVKDIQQSVRKIEERIGAPCKSFAFPNGNYTGRLAAAALASGVSSVMTTEPLWVSNTAQMWRLPRVQIYEGTSAQRQAMKLLAASLGGIMPDPNGTGREYVRIHREAKRRAWRPVRVQSAL